MDRDSHWQIVTEQIDKSIAAVMPHGGGGTVTETRLRHILTIVAERAFQQGESYALLSLLTVQDVAEMLGVSVRRVQALARTRHDRFGIGMQVGKSWLFRPEEVEHLRPGPRSGGRPRKQPIEEAV